MFFTPDTLTLLKYKYRYGREITGRIKTTLDVEMSCPLNKEPFSFTVLIFFSFYVVLQGFILGNVRIMDSACIQNCKL